MILKNKYTQKDLEELQNTLDNSTEYQVKKEHCKDIKRRKAGEVTERRMNPEQHESFSDRSLNTNKGLFTLANLKILNPTIETIQNVFIKHTII